MNNETVWVIYFDNNQNKYIPKNVTENEYEENTNNKGIRASRYKTKAVASRWCNLINKQDNIQIYNN